jgi:hypothetical protein
VAVAAATGPPAAKGTAGHAGHFDDPRSDHPRGDDPHPADMSTRAKSVERRKAAVSDRNSLHGGGAGIPRGDPPVDADRGNDTVVNVTA